MLPIHNRFEQAATEETEKRFIILYSVPPVRDESTARASGTLAVPIEVLE
jgi:hypothetical protein